MTKSSSKVKKPFPYLIAVLISFIFLAFLAYYVYQDIEHTKVNATVYETNNRDQKFDLVESILSENYIRAKINAEKLANNIVYRIEERWNRVLIQYYLDRLNMKNNPIVAIIADELSRPYVYMNVVSDANDPWVAILTGVISDLSKDCASTDGRIRLWASEIKLHANPILATQAIHRILELSSPDIDDGRIDLPIFWEFREKQNVKNWPLLKNMTLAGLKNVFLANDGDIHSLETFEFLYPLYLYSKKDLAGRMLIDEQGEWVGNAAQPLIITQGFNLYDAIMSNQTHVANLKRFDTDLAAEKAFVDNELFWKNIVLYAIWALFVVTQVSSARIVHSETIRLLSLKENKETPKAN